MFKVNKYPDGQINVSLNDKDLFILKSRGEIKSYIETRVNSYEDLFILKSFSDAYRNYFGYYPSVFIPCLFGQQSDRRFAPNESFDLKNICEFINSCNFTQVRILDPHSDVGPALLNNCLVLSRDIYVEATLKNLPEDTILVSPDAGAYKKTYKLSENLKRELVAANKFRDKLGNINLNFTGDVRGKNCLIVDDLILGGRTFKELAVKLKENGAQNVYLYVTHFKGLEEWNVPANLLTNGIDRIFFTNSVKDYLKFEENLSFAQTENKYINQFKVI